MDKGRYYLVEKRGAVAWVWLNRASKKNAMNTDAWKSAPPIFEALDADPSVRVIVVAGKGACFCAGIDLAALMNEIPELMEDGQSKGERAGAILKRIHLCQAATSAMERCRKPVIAAIHKHCIGAGLDFITACDIRLCCRDATFSLKEAAMGFVADVGVLQRLPLIVGQGVAREWAYTATTIDASRALSTHLVNAVYEDADALFEGAQVMAEEIAANAPLAVQASKDVLNYGIGKSVDDGLKYVAAIAATIVPSHDLIESLTAFAEKRKPVYKGR